tara:strand:- start:416 stop:676 length:261 start_codon:yes stop_codon:yes gene_type:complete
MIIDIQQYLQHWEKENNPVYPSEMIWDRVEVNRFLKDYKVNKFIGKTVVEIEESNKLDEGIKITFDDGSVLECAWNSWEGSFYATS